MTWRTKLLKDVCAVNYGKSPKQVLSESGIYPVVGTGGVERLADSFIYSGQSIVLGRKGTIDNPTFVDGKFWPIDTTFFLSDFVDVDVKFLFYAFSLKNLRALNESTGVPSVSRGALSELVFDIPDSKKEQKRISEILSTVDAAIGQTQALIDKYGRIKRGLMQDLLTRGIDDNGNVRTKETHKFTVKNGIEIPAEWSIVTLGDLLGKNGFVQTGPFGTQLHSYEYVQEGIPSIMPQDMFEKISTKNINRISEAKANQLKRHRVRENDVIFARRGDLSRCNVIEATQKGWLCGTGCILLRQNQRVINPHWLRLFYQSFYGQLQISINAVGSTMQNLSGALLKGLWLFCIDIKEQDRVVEKLTEIDKTIKMLTDNRAKLESIKKGLMQDLLTGETRVVREI